jgi:hypothetical protein
MAPEGSGDTRVLGDWGLTEAALAPVRVNPPRGTEQTIVGA